MEVESEFKKIYCFFWIRINGLIQFKWYSDQFYENKWDTDDIFLSGFLTAMNSVAEIFFDGNKMSFILFQEYCINLSKIQSGDILAIVSSSDISSDLVETLFKELNAQFYKTAIPEAYVNSERNEKLLVEFHKILEKVKNLKDWEGNAIPISAKPLQSIPVTSEGMKNEYISSLLPNLSQEDAETRPLSIQLLSELKKLNAKIDVLENFAGSAGHLLNNLYAAVLGNIELAKFSDGGSGPDDSLIEAEKYLMKATTLSSQIVNIVKALKSKEKFTELELSTLVSEDWCEDQQITKIEYGNGKILIMDDEPGFLSTTDKLLKKLGYKVDLATNGEDAFDLYIKSIECGQKYDALILDLIVANGMGGKQTLKELLKFDPQVKAIIASGKEEDPIFQEYKRLGFYNVIKKPFNLAKLSQMLKQAVEK